MKGPDQTFSIKAVSYLMWWICLYWYSWPFLSHGWRILPFPTYHVNLGSCVRIILPNGCAIFVCVWIRLKVDLKLLQLLQSCVLRDENSDWRRTSLHSKCNLRTLDPKITLSSKYCNIPSDLYSIPVAFCNLYFGNQWCEIHDVCDHLLLATRYDKYGAKIYQNVAKEIQSSRRRSLGPLQMCL